MLLLQFSAISCGYSRLSAAWQNQQAIIAVQRLCKSYLFASQAVVRSKMAQAWASALSAAAPAVVSIRSLQLRANENNAASFSYATGFVVDHQRGIILTNRHVATTGPCAFELSFANNELIAAVSF